MISTAPYDSQVVRVNVNKYVGVPRGSPAFVSPAPPTSAALSIGFAVADLRVGVVSRTAAPRARTFAGIDVLCIFS